jgi:DMSO reductase family type II enzyme heme b subunit
MTHLRKTVCLVPLAVLGAAAACSRQPVIDARQVTAVRATGTLPVDDPSSRLWDAAPEHPAALMVQDVTEPRLIEPGVPLVRVRALHDGTSIVFRLDWDDPTRDLIPETGKSSDAVAIQFPLQAGADVPDPAMGQAGKGVTIWYWKAVWQDDGERAAQGGKDRVATLYPNAAVDHYPYEGNPAATEEMRKRYAPALAAGNPVTARPNGGAVQVVSAEGFGGSVAAPTQDGSGRGTWREGRWQTTIARPIDRGQTGASLQIGQRTYVAFAVWDGAARHTGSRKMRSGWIPLVLQ